MFEREIGLAGKYPENAAPVPAASEARVEGETTVDQPDRDIDVLAEVSEDEGSECEDVRVLRAASKCPPSKADTGVPRRFRVFGPAAHLEPFVTKGRQGESRAVMRIPFYRLPEQVERPNEAALLKCVQVRECA